MRRALSSVVIATALCAPVQADASLPVSERGYAVLEYQVRGTNRAWYRVRVEAYASSATHPAALVATVSACGGCAAIFSTQQILPASDVSVAPDISAASARGVVGMPLTVTWQAGQPQPGVQAYDDQRVQAGLQADAVAIIDAFGTRCTVRVLGHTAAWTGYGALAGQHIESSMTTGVLPRSLRPTAKLRPRC